VPGDTRPQRVVGVDVVGRHADVVGRRVPGEPDLPGRRLGEGEVAGRRRRVGVAGARAVDLELRDLPGRPGRVGGDVQPQIARGGRAEGDGDRVAAGRVEEVAGRCDEVGEARAGRAGLHGERLRA